MRGDLRLPAAGICAALAAALTVAATPPAFCAGSPAAAQIVGVPEAGSRGITETVADIMARDRVAPGVDGSTLAAEGPPALPQTAGTSFKAIGLSESSFIPPDTAGDVGATQILVHTNGRVRVFAKTGAPGALNVTALSFWAAVGNGSQPVFPQVRYDRLSGRFILLAVTSSQPNNRVMIAVQTTPGTITAASSFTFYWFDQQSGGGSGDNSRVCDSPRLGIDNNALYVGCNMNSTSGSLVRITVYVVRKSSVIPAPGTLVVTAFRDISNGTTGPGPHSPVGVDNDDPQATEGYFVGADIATSGVLQLRRVSNPGGTPTLSGNLTLSVPATASPILQPASGSSVNLEAGDDRVTRASIHKNKLTGATTLWASQSSEVDATCAGAVGGGRNGARWYEIAGSTPTTADPLGGVPTLVQTGTLCDPAGVTPKGYIFPSAVGTGQGHMAMGSTVAAANLFAGAAAAGRLRFDPAGATQAPTTIQSGLASYTFVTAGKNLWGDYSFTDVDPNDDQTVWTFQEYADSPANNWAVRAVQLRAPPPPALTGLQALLCTGVAASPVTLTATVDAPVAGAEFFDPGPDTGGPGYASHLSATATGGVTVNGAPSIVLPASPATQPVLQVTLSLNTTAAPAGLKNVTVRNPDQQATTGTGIVRVDAPVTAVATNNGPICEGADLTLNVTAVPFATYSWTGPNGFTSSLQSPTLPSVSTAASGTYTVTISGVGCTQPPATTTVTVIADAGRCNLANPCTNDVCNAGVCQAGPPVVCDDSNVCTEDVCRPESGCVYTDTTAVACADGNVCTDDACNPVTGCFHPSNTLACSDGNACTAGDVCGGGSCQPGAPITCDDANGCTDDSCAPATGCVFTANTAPCDDGSVCTTGDACGAGICHPGAAIVCDDGNPCTDDSCNPATGCVHTNNTAPCDDGSVCTAGDACSAGSCVGGPPIACDDGNPCTDDSCDSVTGCVHVNNTAPCSDGSLCTVGDVCGQGSCQPGPPPVCDDGNVCTEDTCRPSIGCFHDDISFLTCNDGNACTDDACNPTTGCFHTDNTHVCDDGNACTANDTCSGGVCQPGNTFTCDDGNLCTVDGCDPRYGCVFFDNTAACNDGNPCTTDACNPASGCFHTNNTSACEDGNPCTSNDTCAAGSCVPGTPAVCNDGNVCTDDSCDTQTGCVFAPNAAVCDDGSTCTVGDTCGGGACRPGTPIVCDDGNLCTEDTCNPATGCVFTDTSTTACNDGNVCTDDGCSPATGCVHAPNTAPCDDGNACTTGDTCGGGACQAGAAVACDDGNPCTDDSCAPATGCVHATNTSACDDGNACTTGDTCGGGTCQPGAPVACDDGNPCTDDSCSPATGCVFSNNAAPCDDGSVCTAGDVCGGGSCRPGAAVNCDDGNQCTADSCSPVSGCVHADVSSSCNDGNACTADSCNPATGCVFTDTSASCVDSNPCTSDSCNPATGCVFANNTAPCDDANACTAGDTCGGGTCHAGTAISCNDGNVCTTDSCNPATGCAHANNALPCSDGNACTTGDTCGGGSCQPGGATICNDNNACTTNSCNPATGCVFTDNSASCNDGNVCTTDSCSPATGCVHTNVTGSCNDQSACTTGDACVAGVCQGTAITCNDSNLCTADSCNPATGCVFTDITASCNDNNPCTSDSCMPNQGCRHQNVNGSCSDGNACTTGDFCQQGTCRSGSAVTCNDNSVCTVDSCSPATGCVFTDTTATQCNDGNPCTNDLCNAVTGCFHANNTSSCSDGNACTTGDVCGGGTCHAGSATVCNDGNPCTSDSCSPATGCVFTNNANACSDGNACTTGDICSGGSCQPGSATVCNDGNPCTNDSCSPATGCVFANNTNACNDGNACTTGDACGGGSCQPGSATVCNDNNPCTNDSCNPATGCVFASNTNACDDGNACTTGDACGGGSCQPGTATVCNDSNPCTDDTCSPATGCVFANNTNACDDGIACTTADACNAGTCAGTPFSASEVSGFALSGSATTTLSWTIEPLGAVYDVATSTLSDLATTGVAGATCLVSDEPTTSFVDPQPSPPPGAGYYYLVRAQSVCGTGSYGNSSANVPRVPTTDCP